MKKVYISKNIVIDLFSKIELVKKNYRLIPKYLLHKGNIYRCTIPVNNDTTENINIFLSNEDIDYIKNKIDYTKKSNKYTNIHLSNLIIPEERYMFNSSNIMRSNILFRMIHNNYIHLCIKTTPLYKGDKLDGFLIQPSILYQFLFLKHKIKNMQPVQYKISSSQYEDIKMQLKCI